MDAQHRIAIVGMGGVLPAAHSLEGFWRNVLAARSAAGEPPEGRWVLPVDQAYRPDLTEDHVQSRRACFVETPPLDLRGLDIEPSLVHRLDPVFHLALAAGVAAWRDAKTSSVHPRRAGVILGNIVLPTQAASSLAEEMLIPRIEKRIPVPARGSASRREKSVDPLNRYPAGLPAALLARALGMGLGGYTLDAACASSLYAIKFAADELLAGRADLMLAGGLSRPDSLYTQMGFTQLHAISPTGTCAPFSRRADGLVVGEGCGIVVLKRLADALRDGDRVYAVIAGAGLSNDIGGNLMAPDSEGQLRAMRAAYAQAGWDPSTIDLIECHGTGTPIGDAVEFESMMRLWGECDRPRGRRCVIGSVKSNVGHLLTAAGAAGVIKTLFSLANHQLPPTANFNAPSERINLNASPFCVMTEPQDWPAPPGDRPRRAAVSAFGFGGINAHLLLEEHREAAGRSRVSVPGIPSEANSDAAIVVVGIDARFGPWRTISELSERFFGRDDTPPEQLNDAWAENGEADIHGHFIDKVDVPVGRFRIPPSELRDMLPQQLLMLTIAANALEDAGFENFAAADEALRTRTGVYIGIALDLNTTNYHLRWSLAPHARRWARVMGLDLSETELEEWLGRMRAALAPALSANRVMGSLGGIVASRIARAFRIGGPSFTLSSEDTSGLRAIERAVRALEKREIDVAIVGAIDLPGDPRAALNRPQRDRHAPVGEGAAALILKRHDDAVRDEDRIHAILRDVGEVGEPCDGFVEMPDAAADLGHTGAAASMATLVKAVLSLRHRTLPPVEGEAESPRYWLHDRQDGPRRAVVRGCGFDGHERRIVIEEASFSDHVGAATKTPVGLFPVHGEDADTLLRSISELEAFIARHGDTSLRAVAAAWHVARSTSSAPLSGAIVAADHSQLRSRLQSLRAAVAGRSRVADEGVYHSPDPLAASGEIAFVFPGSGNHYGAMGRELALAFPEVLERQHHENARLRSQFAGGRFWRGAPVPEDDHLAMIFGQVWLGSMVSDIVRACGVEPRAVLGYSLGETAGLFALRAWKQRDEMLERLRRSSLFTRDLVGPCLAARSHWNLDDDESVQWRAGVLNLPANEVRRALDAFNGRVYLLIVNTPDDCVIGGQAEEVERFVGSLGCPFHPIDGISTVHCEVARPVAEAYRELHLFGTSAPEGVRFYSAAMGKARKLTRESAADSIVAQALVPFDFTKVVESAWSDGARIFLEMGPGASCTRMIGRILEGRPHIARAMCVRGRDDVMNLHETLALLISEGVPVKLEALYGQADAPASRWADAPVVSVRTQLAGFDPPSPPIPATKPAPRREAVTAKVLPQRTCTPAAGSVPTMTLARDLQPVIEVAAAGAIAHARAEHAFLTFSQGISASIARAATLHEALGQSAAATLVAPSREVFLDRDQCFEFARGRIGNVLGPRFAAIDAHPTRVRLPDEPLQLVDRIVEVEGEALSMTSGRVVTEHDILPGAWYLDGGRIPTCIAVEAGQADLFLSGYLGIDFETKGLAVYRLLDAAVTFHGPLPGPLPGPLSGAIPGAGRTIHYDIRIREFFHQGDTWLFRFEFDATVDGALLLTMRSGCAGFFTPETLAAGQGIVLTAMDRKALPGKRPADWRTLAPMPDQGDVETYSDEQVSALRGGGRDALVRCFGQAFAGLELSKPVGLPGGRMTLVHRVLRMNPHGGRFGLGVITGEADIRLEDWFLTCHFIDDQVMPGTLMYECCLHTLRIFLLRLGWVGEADEVAYEPVPGVTGQLKCRGQVTTATRKVQYEITLKELGYEQGDGAPYAIADALMSADGRPIVRMTDMSLRMSGTTRGKIESLWSKVQSQPSPTFNLQSTIGNLQSAIDESSSPTPDPRPLTPAFDRHHILAFAIGKPSEAFGDRYRVFDEERKIARLPGPPFAFLDRIVTIEGCEPWKLAAGGVIEAEYDVPLDAWYFAANRQREMPFAVLLEAALQPCGWFAAYLGSALTSEVDLRFRNLGGKATLHRAVTPQSGTLRTKVKITSVSTSGGMIIQHFAFDMRDREGDVYTGTTYFGFFTAQALANQVGIRDADLYVPSAEDRAQAAVFDYPQARPFPNDQWRMIDHVELFAPRGGAHGLGFIRGAAQVNPEAWFFKAHFYQDPVWPGSLGLESFIQLVKVAAWERWGGEGSGILGLESGAGEGQLGGEFGTMAPGQPHEWVYRGQIIPRDKRVTVEATITGVDDARRRITADGWLSVDGRVIYRMRGFTLTMSGE